MNEDHQVASGWCNHAPVQFDPHRVAARNIQRRDCGAFEQQGVAEARVDRT
jgi:hypothetical protein